MRTRDWVSNVTLALCYALVYVTCYVLYLHPYYEYAGFALYPRDALFHVTSVAIAVLPVGLYRGPKAISSLIAVFIYLIVYVPVILTFALGSGSPPGEILLVQLTFMGGMCLLFLADAIIIEHPFAFDLGVNVMPAILALTISGTLYVAAVYGGSLSFASFADVYVLRAANQELGTGLVTRYLTSWLSTVLVPLCFAYGLVARRPRYFLAGAAACLVLYMAAANKVMILLPVVYLGFYYLAKNRLRLLLPALCVAMSVAMLVLMIIATPDSLLFFAGAILLNRTIGNSGQVSMVYYDFFNVHPQTNYSHVTGIKTLTGPYPYGDLGVGQVVGEFYWAADMNANANFWATDGLAAMGLIGVPVASAACFLLLVAMNSVTRTYDRLFVVLCFLPFVITLLNQSMFSAIWSGGAFFLLLFFLLNKRRDFPIAFEDAGVTARPVAAI